jgi:hypothetical protein
MVTFLGLKFARIVPIFTISGQGTVASRTGGAPPPTLNALKRQVDRTRLFWGNGSRFPRGQ